jgi:phosphoribosylamine--glycine ligase
MKVLVIGSGGREHALVWSLLKNKKVDKVYCCPGNAGISRVAECLDIRPDDFKALTDLAKYEWIDMTVVGPEQPQAAGIVDAFQKEGLKIIGPVARAAMLETSKVYAKEFMRDHGIPTAGYKVFSSYLHVEEHVRMMGAPVVIKADGLAAGKGVVVAKTVEAAIDAARLIMKERAFGDAGNRVVVEDCIEGEEASFMVFTDGRTIVPMVSSQDHKRAYDGDKGPNTGGMGAYSPAPVVTPAIEKIVMDTVMRPVINGLRKKGIKYKGFLYAGLMIKDGRPYVLEFNCRFGDPEAQAVLMRLETDFLDVLTAINDETLDRLEIKWKPGASVCVVMASGGYPGGYENGKIISGIDNTYDADVQVFHSGTVFRDNRLVTSGGRVLGVTALGKDVADARRKAYDAVAKITFDGAHYRKDIAHRALERTEMTGKSDGKE